MFPFESPSCQSCAAILRSGKIHLFDDVRRREKLLPIQEIKLIEPDGHDHTTSLFLSNNKIFTRFKIRKVSNGNYDKNRIGCRRLNLVFLEISKIFSSVLLHISVWLFGFIWFVVGESFKKVYKISTSEPCCG